MEPRRELVSRLVCRSLCAKCRDDRLFRRRTDDLIAGLRDELPAIRRDAAKLEAELTAAVEAP